MEEMLSALVGAVNLVLWDYLLIYALLGIGLFFTIYLGAPQVTKLGAGFKSVFGGLFAKKDPADKDHKSLSQFQALAVAVSAQIGTGNVAGVATAITAGGPGAVFWMWFSAVLGMSTIFAEALLAQKYRVVSHGKYIGGPAFYITHGLTPKIGRGAARFLSGFFSIALIIALGFIGNATQSNSIASAVTVAFDVPALAVGIGLAALAGLIIVGGVNRIANVAQFVVPFMAVIYIICAVVILFQFSDHISPMINHIFVAAFNPEAVLGGAAGIGMREAVRFGVARGLFSNEAGMGSTPHAHATADVNHDSGVYRHCADYPAHRCRQTGFAGGGGNAAGVCDCLRRLRLAASGDLPDLLRLHHHHRLVLLRRIQHPLPLPRPPFGHLPHAGTGCDCVGHAGQSGFGVEPVGHVQRLHGHSELNRPLSAA